MKSRNELKSNTIKEPFKKSMKIKPTSNFFVFGICAMEKKVKSRPMLEILNRLKQFTKLKVIVFPEILILNTPVTDWPVCGSFLSFYSHGFPLHKSVEYVRIRKPYLINDVTMQDLLTSRIKIYQLLKIANIRVPRHLIMDRSDPAIQPFMELDDSIEINGDVMIKPFVEKPVDAEDHNVYIYFPTSAGGGRQELFRKVGNKSSFYSKNSNVRRDSSYIYEEFMPTDGTDIKVYTVGTDYAHAEARKSPALDGKVERDADGKEIRYPIILSQSEKMIAKNIVNVFRQQICGVDLLRVNGVSYICDVNGFSFVKTSNKYFDDCAYILGNMLTKNMSSSPGQEMIFRHSSTKNSFNLVPTTSGKIMELRCIIAVIRHGDRTPKQKIKLEVKHKRFHDLFRKYSVGSHNDEVKLKKPSELQDILDIINEFMTELELNNHLDPEIEEKKNKFIQMKTVLELYGHFTGINRKVQLKYIQSNTNQGNFLKRKFRTVDAEVCRPLLVILKWGGELTNKGCNEAERLGQEFRCLYPGGTGVKGESSGQGLLRLHSTYRHDLKIYASDEGRVQMTAAAFARGFLALEGQLPPILVQMVKSANTNGLLDNENESQINKSFVKKQIFELLSQEKDLSVEDYRKLAPCSSKALTDALSCIGNPARACQKLHKYIKGHLCHLERLYNLTYSINNHPLPLYHQESWELLLRRWRKLNKEFRSSKNKSSGFDLSKIPDIYDNIKYDLHNNPLIIDSNHIIGFFKLSKCLADIIVPQEYGITTNEKLEIGRSICTPLLRKIANDVQYSDPDSFIRLHPEHSQGITTPDRFVRTRLYFTSESHIHSMLSCIRYGDLCDPDIDTQWRNSLREVANISELNYLSQIVFMIYEDPSYRDSNLPNRYRVELHISPGSHYINDSVYSYFKYCNKRNTYRKRNQPRRTSSTSDIELNSTTDAGVLENSEFYYCCEKKRSLSVLRHEDFENDLIFPCENKTFSKNFIPLEEISVPSNVDMNSMKSEEEDVQRSSILNNSKTIYPLRVLHNKLNVNHLEEFLERMTLSKLLKEAPGNSKLVPDPIKTAISSTLSNI